MPLDIQIVSVPEAPFLYRLVTCLQSEIGPSLMREYGVFFSYLESIGEFPSAPIAHYVRWEDSECEIRAGVLVPTLVMEGEGNVMGVYGGCDCVMGNYVGPYSGLYDAHQAVLAWAKEHGVALRMDSWEYYVDPGKDGPETARTEVYWPVA